MEIKITESKDKVMRFNVTGIDASLANALRRIVVSELPIMAMEMIRFEENSSILNDEILAHRLGLVPLKTDLKTFNPMSECTCNFKGCGKCSVILALNKKGPGIVYSGDLKSNDPNVIPAYDKIPLVKLTEKQNVKLEAVAELGFGKDHVKWQAGLASYEMVGGNKFNFFVESYGQLTPKEMVLEAFKLFNEKISKLEKELR